MINKFIPETIFREYSKNEGLRSDRSAGDRARHRVKVRQSIKENIADIISDESIIGQSGDKIIKVPIRGLKEYRFVFGDNKKDVSQGDGDTQPGQVVGKKGQSQGQGKGQGGTEGHVDIYETEITLDELKEILFEDLQLPRLRRTAVHEITQKNRTKRTGYKKKGIEAHFDRKKTAKERVKRKVASNRSITLNLENDNSLTEDEKRFPFHDKDLRYKKFKEKPKPQSNAAIMFLIDSSGSMDIMKKFLARSFFNILYEFIKDKYDKSEVVFVVHDTEATEVDEEKFFRRGEGGGTIISSGLKKILEIINERYNPSLWNNYFFQSSDGDNSPSDNEKVVKLMNELTELCNLIGYAEIKPEENSYWSSSMLDLYKNSIKSDNFKMALIKDKTTIWPTLKDWLSIDNNSP